MKNNYRLLSLIFIVVMAFSCTHKQMPAIKIIPQPQQMQLRSGSFKISDKTPLIVSGNELLPMAELFNSYLGRISGLELNISKGNETQNGILLKLSDDLADEEYSLNVGKNITLLAANYKGLARGLASLVQFISVDNRISKVSISDKPDYAYRCVMLDLARFWHPVETIKETIDLLWLYKIPYLQLHLSDNRRFTFPLDEFPDLKTVKEDGSREYYTRKELDDLVEYAKQRGIIIIPEVELPGHSGQLFTKYPEIFGSINKKTGEANYLYVINMAKGKAYQAAEKIVNELAEVFYTSPYIHIGCDEVYLEVLKTVPEYKTFCKKHGLNTALNGDANELFCYFINRMNEMVKAAGKKSIIWEGFHGIGAGSQTIAKEIPVIVWNTSYNHPDSLLQNGYEIINSTWIPWYMVGAMNFAPSPEKGFEWDVNKWAHWNEIYPDILLDTKDGIRGGQISFWEQTHYKVIPVLKERVPVLAERLWNNKATDYNDFKNRLVASNSLFEKLFQPVKISATGLTNNNDQRFTETASISLESALPGTIKYQLSDSWDLSNLKNASDYKQALNLKNSTVLTVQLFDEHGNAVGFPVQKYYQKIEPAYRYKVFGGAPQHGWSEMPDFDTLPIIREGVSGFMTPERLEKINGELFAKVKKEGHIDVRFNGLYNPYAVELKGNIKIPADGEYEFRIQTWDGLAELYIDGNVVGKGTEFGNKPEDFKTKLRAGKHLVSIKYFYQKIQNQLSIQYKTAEMNDFVPFEKLIQSIQ